LVAPLVAVAAQYGMFAVLAFCLLTTGLELYFAGLLADIGSVPPDFYGEQAVIRNLIFLSVGFIISRLIKEQRRQRKDLREANEQLAQFAVTLEQLAVSRERNRMARDLHDTLAHTLSAVAIQLEAVTAIWDSSPDKARDRIETIQQLTRDGLKDTRHALQALRTSPLDDLGLALAIQMMGYKSADRAGFRIHTSLPDNLPELPVEVELSLYRIVEEAFNNIVRHAEATDVWVRVEATKKTLLLSVRDNGIGFDSDAEPPEGHFGLVGMRERATLVGAEITIISNPFAGTKITLSLGL
ncbi:MAG: sensor histidine kinase, partial [Chloroflexota bacterium]